jgi:hypothetical protein
LPFQVTFLLAGKVRDDAIRGTPRVRLMADHARCVQTTCVGY